MASAERKAAKWATVQARKAAMVYGAPAPTDRDERADRERGLLEAHLARRECDD